MAWINLENLSSYHRKIKEYIDSKVSNNNGGGNNVPTHKFNVLQIGNQETSIDFNTIVENGMYYGNYNSLFTNGFLGKEQHTYAEFTMIVLGMNGASPALKTQLVFNRVTYEIYMRCCLSWQEPWNWGEWEKVYTQHTLNQAIQSYNLVLEPNTPIVNLTSVIGNKQLLENSLIYIDGIKLIKDIHYNINKENKTVTILNPYNHKVNFEAIIFN